MNNFAEIVLIQQFDKVCYYSVVFEGDEYSQFYQFKEKHSKENKQKFDHIFAWIKKIGEITGARDSYFRNEAKLEDTRALPPKKIGREPTYIEFDQITKENQVKPNNLRLYCYRANEHVVILFNGDVKTKQNPEDCENVRNHFLNANKLSVALQKAFINRELKWNEDFTNIIADDDFVLNW